MTSSNAQTHKTTEDQNNSVLPDASDFDHNATGSEASIFSTLPDADEISQSDPLQRPPEIRGGSDLSTLPNASEVDTSITEAQDTSMSTRRSLSNQSDAADQDDNTELPEDKSSFVSTENEDTADLLYCSDPDDSDYHESDVSTSTFIYINKKREADSAFLPAAENAGVGDQSVVSTHGSRPVIDDYSNLSDAFDANDDSGSFDARPLVSTPTYKQLSSFSDANHSNDCSTSSDIKMAEGSMAATSAVGSETESAIESSAVGSSTVGSSGDVTVTPSEDVKPSKILTTLTDMALLTTFSTMIDNLFFRQDDGTVLAVRIEPAAGPHLLRAICALSQPTGSPSQLSELPFAATAAKNLDDDLANEAQTIPSRSRASTRLPSSAAVRSKKASTSVKTLAPVRGTSAATSSRSSPTPSTVAPGTIAQMDAVFSSADGNPYDRDWISKHGLNGEVLTEIPNSKHKLDLLVRHGAVVAGDKLCVTYHSSGSPVVIEGEVSSPTNMRLTEKI